MASGLKYPPFARPRRETPSRGAPPGADTPSADELPPIENFLDELPSIDDFLEDSREESGFDEVEAESLTHDEPLYEDEVMEPAASSAPTAEGWAAGDWQSYDWGSLSALGRGDSLSASESWGEMDWPLADEVVPASSSTATPDADEIANALDGIARRIRSGELVINTLAGTSPEAAMAAALAVLLRMRG